MENESHTTPKRFKHNNVNLYETTRKEKCKYRKQTFKNQFDLIVHNTKSLKIRCLTQFMKCTCGRYFPTGELLQLHNETDHVIKVANIEPVSWVREASLIKVREEEKEANLLQVREEEKEANLIKVREEEKEANLIKEKEKEANEIKAREEKMIGNEIKIEVNGPDPWTMLMKEDSLNNLAIIDWDDCLIDDTANSEEELEHKPDSTTGDLMLPQNDIKSKLIFEDDYEDDDLILRYEEDVDSTTVFKECNNVNGDNLFNNDASARKYFNQVEIRTKVETVTPSVHNDELMVPGDYKCNICRASFPNRFNLICHETSHVTIRRRNRLQLCYICDYYIAGNYIQLRRHYLKKHPGKQHKILHNWKKCSTCHLKCYSVAKHNENYHSIYVCPNCTSRFDCEARRDEHMNNCNPQLHKPTVSKLIKVCDICFLFSKNTKKHRYRDMGVYSEKGARISCERCEKKFFEVKLVEMTRNVQDYVRVDKKPLTNECRLRNIQQRLKMYNKRIAVCKVVASSLYQDGVALLVLMYGKKLRGS